MADPMASLCTLRQQCQPTAQLMSSLLVRNDPNQCPEFFLRSGAGAPLSLVAPGRSPCTQGLFADVQVLVHVSGMGFRGPVG